MQNDDDDDSIGEISNSKMLKILLQEVADVRLELKQDIASSHTELKQHIVNLDQRMKMLDSKFDVLRLEVHQNQATFIQNHDSLERRVVVLERR
jgi:hypothetical protein